MGNVPQINAAVARSGIYSPPRPLAKSVTNDGTSAIFPGVQSANFTFVLSGANTNRVYILIQNNTAVSLALGFGAPNKSGIKLLSGGYYERELYTPIQQIFATLLAPSIATDYVSVEEGSTSLL